MDEQTKLLALAHLKNGKTPTDVSEIMDITYARALKLKKQLYEAEQADTVLDLFKLNDAALEMLLESVKKNLEPAIEAFGIGELVDDEVTALTSSVAGAKVLDQSLQNAATALSEKIATAALCASNADTLLTLAKSLSELQSAFFPTGGVAGTGVGSRELPSPSNFERHLKP